MPLRSNQYGWDMIGTFWVKDAPTTATEQQWDGQPRFPVYTGNIPVMIGLMQPPGRSFANHQISLSSGTDISRMAISLSYYNHHVQKDQDYKRINANISRISLQING